jgi:hypothetical protein
MTTRISPEQKSPKMADKTANHSRFGMNGSGICEHKQQENGHRITPIAQIMDTQSQQS